jgi:hypothetical protein
LSLKLGLAFIEAHNLATFPFKQSNAITLLPRLAIDKENIPTFAPRSRKVASGKKSGDFIVNFLKEHSLFPVLTAGMDPVNTNTWSKGEVMFTRKRN